MIIQLAKKVMSDSPGLVDFAVGLVIFASVVFGENSNYGRIVINSANQNRMGAS